MDAVRLSGRGAECAALSALLRSARDGAAGCLVLRGEAGIGKTALLRWAAAQAASDGQVLRCTGEQSSLALPFSALAALVEPLRDHLAALPAPQAAALASALGTGPAVGGDRFTVATATLSLLALAAESRPLLLLVDDVQWLDVSSAEALLFAVRRLRAERIACLLAARPAPGGDALVGLPELAVRGLSAAAAGELLTARSGTTASPAAVAAIVAETGGNPLALLELPVAGPLDAAAPPQLSDRLQRAFGDRLRELPASARSAMLLLAAGGTSGSGVLGPALRSAGLAPADLEPAEAAGLVEVRGDGVAFAHPLVRAAAYYGADSADRAAAHLTLALAWEADRGPRAEEHAVRHRAAAAAGPDAAVADRLATVADRAAGRASYAASLELYERAASLTPDPEVRASRLLHAAQMTLPAGQVAAVGRLVDAILTASTDDRLRTEAQHVRCRVEMWGGQPLVARELLRRLADETEPTEPLSAAVMLSHAALVSATLGEQPLADALVTRATALLGDLPDEWALPVLLLRALVDALGSRADASRALLDRCDPHLALTDPLGSDQLVLVAGLTRLSIGDADAARRQVHRAVEAARAAGALGLLPFQLSWLSRLEWLAGSWDEAYAAAHDAVALARETGWLTELPNSLLALAWVEASTDRAEACRAHCAEASALAVDLDMELGQVRAGTVLGLLELGAGRPAEAVTALRPAERFAARFGLLDPVLLPWAGDLAEALVRSGRPAEAGRALAVLDDEAARSGRPAAFAVAARVRGLLGAAAPGTTGHQTPVASQTTVDAAFAEALRWHDEADETFARARTELCLGEHLWRTGRRDPARARLASAAAMFGRLGAPAWAAQAGRQLDAPTATAAPSGPTSLRALTPQELQVALRVAGGESNAEAATALFLSKKTIEFHLGNVYRKLGLRSRAQLARAVARTAVATA